MIAIILAAGLGSRLKQLTQSIPKALLRVNDKLLIDYSLEFVSNKVDQIIIIGGFQYQLLKYQLKEKKINNLTIIENPDFTKGSILTLEKALDYIEDSFLLMNVDHIYPSHFIDKIINNVQGITAMCDFDRSLVQDDMKIKLNQDQKIVEIDKQLADYDGGYIGMTSCHRDHVEIYKKMVQTAIRLDKNKNVEYVLQLLANEDYPLSYLDFSGSTWLEIDDEQDLIKAESILKYRSLT